MQAKLKLALPGSLCEGPEGNKGGHPIQFEAPPSVCLVLSLYCAMVSPFPSIVEKALQLVHTAYVVVSFVFQPFG